MKYRLVCLFLLRLTMLNGAQEKSCEESFDKSVFELEHSVNAKHIVLVDSNRGGLGEYQRMLTGCRKNLKVNNKVDYIIDDQIVYLFSLDSLTSDNYSIEKILKSKVSSPEEKGIIFYIVRPSQGDPFEALKEEIESL